MVSSWLCGYESLGRHLSPSPSVHDFLLVSLTQRPLLSPSLLGATFLAACLMNRMGKLLDKAPWMRFARPLHTPLLPMSLSISMDRRKDVSHASFSLLLHGETELGWERLQRLDLSWDESKWFAEATAQVLMNLALIPCEIYRVLFSSCVCVCINPNGERWELALSDLEREIDESVYLNQKQKTLRD